MKIEIISGGKNVIPAGYNTIVKINGKQVNTKHCLINELSFYCNAYDSAAKWHIGFVEPKKRLNFRIKRLYYRIKNFIMEKRVRK